MAVLVVAGSAKDVGKTSLICGMIPVLSEFPWVAVKITSHAHGKPEPLWEETRFGQETDTARFLAAGARRAFLVSAEPDELPVRLRALRTMVEPDTHWIFESNQSLFPFEPDICIAVVGANAEAKASFESMRERADAVVTSRGAAASQVIRKAGQRVFRLAAFDRIPSEMIAWMRETLHVAEER
jgi:hypothetical protein